MQHHVEKLLRRPVEPVPGSHLFSSAYESLPGIRAVQETDGHRVGTLRDIRPWDGTGDS
jgi:hypothetical protein